ncbi:MAG: Chromosome partition protein MukE [Sodalis sp.]|nr:MAG: Chromosome partition protein MukE [Sodalis sp.]
MLKLRQKLQEKVRASLRRLRRLSIVWFMGNNSSKFHIAESVFRFGADVRAGDDPREAQLQMIRDGGAMPLKNALSLCDDQDANDVKMKRLPTKARMALKTNRYD